VKGRSLRPWSGEGKNQREDSGTNKDAQKNKGLGRFRRSQTTTIDAGASSRRSRSQTVPRHRSGSRRDRSPSLRSRSNRGRRSSSPRGEKRSREPREDEPAETPWVSEKQSGGPREKETQWGFKKGFVPDSGARAAPRAPEEHRGTNTKYKQDLCKWEMKQEGSCRKGAKCQWAHGSKDLRPKDLQEGAGGSRGRRTKEGLPTGRASASATGSNRISLGDKPPQLGRRRNPSAGAGNPPRRPKIAPKPFEPWMKPAAKGSGAKYEDGNSLVLLRHRANLSRSAHHEAFGKWQDHFDDVVGMAWHRKYVLECSPGSDKTWKQSVHRDTQDVLSWGINCALKASRAANNAKMMHDWARNHRASDASWKMVADLERKRVERMGRLSRAVRKAWKYREIFEQTFETELDAISKPLEGGGVLKTYKLPNHLGLLFLTLRCMMDGLGMLGANQSGYPFPDNPDQGPLLPSGFPDVRSETEDEGEDTDLDDRAFATESETEDEP